MELRLSGPPKIGGHELPMPSMNAAMVLEWDDSASIYVRRQDGTRLRRRRQRGRLRFGWQQLTYDQAAVLREALQAFPIVVVPRTRANGDPPLEELEYEMRLASSIPDLDALWREGVAAVVELETVRLFARQQGLAVGGWYLLEEDAGGALIEGYGDATTETERYQVTFMGDTYTRGVATLGPPFLFAVRSRPGDQLRTRILSTTPAPE